MRFLPSKILLCAMLFTWTETIFALGFDMTLNFREDGGADAVMECVIPDKAAGILRAYSLQLSDGEYGGLLDEEGVRRQFREMEGAFLKTYNIYTLPGERRVRLQAEIRDVRKFLEREKLEGITLKDSEIPGDLILELALPETGELTETRKALLRKLSGILGGIQVVLHIQTPTAIIETTGTVDAFDRCHWKAGLEDILAGKIQPVRMRW